MRRHLVRALLVFVVLFAALAGTTFFIATTDAGARWVLARVESAAGGKLNWAAADGTLLSGMRIADLAYDDGASLLLIQRLEFAWQPWRLLDGTLVLDRVDIVGLRHQTRVAGEPLTEEALRGMLFDLPIAIELRAFRVDDIEATSIDGTMTAIDIVTGAAALDDETLLLSDLELRQGEARASGELQLTNTLALDGSLAWTAAFDGQTYAGTLEAGGTLRAPQLTHELTQPLQVTSSGTLNAGLFAGDAVSFDLQHELPLQSLALINQPDVRIQVGARTSGTPEQIAIDGAARAEVPAFAPFDLGFALAYRDNAVVINSATVTSPQIGLQGNGVLELEPLALRFDWVLDALDAGAGLPQLELEGVSGMGSVQLADNGGALAGALQLGSLTGTLNGYPLSVSGLVNASADGTASLELQAANGANTIDVSGTAGDELALAWELQLPEPQALWQELSGSLAGSGTVSGPRDAPEASGTLDGSLRLARDGEVLELDTLTLAAEYGAGGNDVRLGLGTFTRTADGVATVLLQRGELTATGTPEQHTLRADLRGPADSLQLSLQGAAANGNWRGTLQDVALASRAGDWELEAPAVLNYNDAGFTVEQHCWTYLQTRVCLQGGKSAAAQGIDANVALASLPLGWLNPAAEAPPEKPAALQQLQDAFALNLPAGVRTEGLLDAQVSVRNLAGGEWDSLDVVLEPRNWFVEVTQQLEEEDEEVEPLVQRFGLETSLAELQGGANGWAGAVDVRITHDTDGAQDAQGTLRGSGELAADGTISGSADLAFGDLRWLEFLTPLLRDPAGMLNGTIGISGTTERPLLQANMELSNGRFDVPLYGLQIRNASVELDTDASNVMRLAGTAQSGQGLLQLDAEVRNPLQDSRQITADLRGADFLAFATDYASVTVTPQLTGSLADSLLTLNGSVEVKDTDIDLEGLFGAGGENAVGVSRDVVIVSGETAGISTAQDALRVQADVDVHIGPEVHVTGYDLDAMLSGELRVEQAPGRPVLVYGELEIPQGRYEIYNQVLNARDGRLVFFGNPANPLLDVRAFREIESGEVGVHLTGNLESIQGRLYSTPTLPDNEALALLVTGKSFGSVNAQESDALVGAIASFGLRRGAGFTDRVGSSLGLDTFTVGAGNTLEDSALGLGKYLTPDLLMRYKLGLFDRQSVLGIEYTLSERLKLEVETGISQSVDLNYTVEKD